MSKIYKIYKPLLLILLFSGWGSLAVPALASRIDELRSQIEDRNQKIKELEKEIAGYQKQFASTAEEAKTLKGEVQKLDKTIQKLDTDIKLTQQQIEKTSFNIERLSLEIDNRQSEILIKKETIREAMRMLRERDEDSLVEIILAEQSLASVLAEQDRLTRLQAKIAGEVETLKILKSNLEEEKGEVESERDKLFTLETKFLDQKKLQGEVRSAKNILLKQTKNQEANYKKLLTESQGKREAFLRELFDFESQLRAEIDPASLPPAGSGALFWPLDSITITQHFGRTVDARRLYLSGSHNGIDLRASIGTSVKAAASGVVVGIGDTDTVCRGASYGKWVLIRHQNGLSTLYTHLSLIKVSEGKTIAPGEVIGYSGQSGYATGPHLHFTVFATIGVRIADLPSQACPGATFRIPLAPTNAYFDPLQYV